MRLNPEDFSELKNALIAAFPRKDNLKQMVRLVLERNLEEITNAGEISTIVFDLITWAESQGKLARLITGAHEMNPDNPILKAFHERWITIQNAPNSPSPLETWVFLIIKYSDNVKSLFKSKRVQKSQILNRLTRKSRIFSIVLILVIVMRVSGFSLVEKIQSIIPPYISNPELFSQGEKSLFLDNINHYQIQGIDEFKKGDYSAAETYFKKSMEVYPSNPEFEIYGNNAQAHQKQKKENIKLITLAVVLPVNANRETSKDILRGVAQAQTEFNKLVGTDQGSLKNRLLNIVIADDSNKPEQAKKVAQELIKDTSILGVIGHSSSAASELALLEYEKADLAMVSPSSSSNKLNSKVFFRTIPDNESTAELLSNYAIKHKIKRMSIYYSYGDTFSDDIKDKFKTSFLKKGGTDIDPIDLGERNLAPEVSLTTNIKKSNGAVFLQVQI